jgi:hypothetical protein
MTGTVNLQFQKNVCENPDWKAGEGELYSNTSMVYQFGSYSFGISNIAGPDGRP